LKAIFLVVIFCFVGVVPMAYAQSFDRAGLLNRFDIETGGYSFEVETVSNFDVTDYEFSSDEKRLTFFISSNVQNNLIEIQIPKNLINGNFTFYLNDEQIFANVLTNDKISFITAEFEGNGFHKLDIIGTTYLPEFSTLMLVFASMLSASLVIKLFPRMKLY
jgi:hypothetical protein